MLTTAAIVSSCWFLAAPIQDGLEAHWTFNEGQGTTVSDIEGGRAGTLNGNTMWTYGGLRHVAGVDFGWTSLPRDSMMQADWTIDLWFSAVDAGEHGAGRLLSGATGVGGLGPEWLFRDGLKVGMRINNDGATWDEPTIGTRSSAAPPDHYAVPTTAVAANTPSHLVMTHDATQKRVIFYQAAADAADLQVVFDGTYSGTYQISVADLRLSHSHDPAHPRYVDSTFDSIAIYGRVLSASEAQLNHDSGPLAVATSDATDIGVSDSGHYFTYKGKTKLVLGDSGTQCVMQNTNIDHRAWIDQLAAEGHTSAHIWGFVAPRQQLDGSELESRYGYLYPGITPWKRRSDGASAHDGGTQWDLLTFDEGTDPYESYWPRFRDLCSYSAERNIMLGVTVFFGWPKYRENYEYHPFATANGGHAGGRAEITNIHSPGVEVYEEPWNSTWPALKKTQWLWEKYALKLIEAANGCRNVWFDFRDEWSYAEDTNAQDHFRSFFKRRGQIWADRSGLGDLLVTNPHVPPFGTLPAIKTEGDPYDHEGVRREAWQRALSGIHYLLHNDSRDPGIMAWDSQAAALRGLDPLADAGRQYVGFAARFFTRYVQDLNSLLPSNHLVNNGAHCLASPGNEYVIYVPKTAGSVDVDLSATMGSIFRVHIYDIRQGIIDDGYFVQSTGVETITMPDAEDWVVLITPETTVFSDGAPSDGGNPDGASADGGGYDGGGAEGGPAGGDRVTDDDTRRGDEETPAGGLEAGGCSCAAAPGQIFVWSIALLLPHRLMRRKRGRRACPLHS